MHAAVKGKGEKKNAYETFSTLCNLWLMGKVWREGKEQRRAEPEPERDRVI